MKSPEVSVIVPVYRQHMSLGWLLAALSAQDCREPFEILVCDDGSFAGHVSQLEHAASRWGLDVRYVWQAREGHRVSRSRNNGIHLARGRLLVFLDGDMVPPPDFLSRHLQAHAGSRRLVSGTRRWVFLPQGDQPAADPDIYAMLLPVSEVVDQWDQFRLACSSQPWLACLGCNLSVPRANEAMFDEMFTGWGFEDREFACRMVLRHNYEHRHLPTLSALHVVPAPREQWAASRTGSSHEQIVQYLAGWLRIQELFPEADFSPVSQIARCCVLDKRTGRWQMDTSTPTRSFAQAAQETRAWWEEGRSHHERIGPDAAEDGGRHLAVSHSAGGR
ncbi:MAG: glycosyltransferase [Bryobacterales bacterium]|nr:glycosyltransferase [Bryobacterales bacterium]